jgi:signal transduction histidine kinase
MAEETLIVSVVDDGAGGAQVTGGSGLRGLYERAEACGGRLTVETAAGEGTTVRLEVPVPA